MRARWLLAAFLGAGCPAFAGGIPKIVYIPPENISPANGPAMFRAYCAVCHGTDARGDGPAAPALKKRPADLTQLARKHGGKFPMFQVARVIEGAGAAHGSREMPIWGAVFRTIGDDSTVALRIGNLTNYLEALQAH